MSGSKGNGDLREAITKWSQGVEEKTKKRPERKEVFLNTSEIPIERLYSPLDLEDANYMSEVGLPGQYPFTRGVQPTMYRGRYWTMRQYAGFASAEESNKRYRFLLEQGQTGLSVAFDLPTQIGFDSDDEMAIGEVGKVGVAIDSLKDMETLFDQIPLDKVSTSMTINAPAAILLAMYIAVAEEQGGQKARSLSPHFTGQLGHPEGLGPDEAHAGKALHPETLAFHVRRGQKGLGEPNLQLLEGVTPEEAAAVGSRLHQGISCGSFPLGQR